MLELVYFKIYKVYYGILYDHGKVIEDLEFKNKIQLDNYIKKLLSKGFSLKLSNRD
jgi:hypothetical protein